MFRKRFNLNHLVYAIIALLLPILITACAQKKTTTMVEPSCAGNRFLQKYNCSLDRIQQAARNGDADAMYALGYMYYYGIGTARDLGSSQLWIQRAANQGQPLAMKAVRLLNQGRSLDQLHRPNNPPAEYHRRVPVINDDQYRAPVRQHPGRVYSYPRPHHAKPLVKQPRTRSEVDDMNEAVPDRPISEHLPNYGKGQKEKPTPDTNTLPNNEEQQPADTPSSDETKPPISLFTPEQMNLMKKAVAHDETELLHVNTNSFTLQLMGSHNLASIEQFVNLHHLQDRVNIYSSKLENGEQWYMLIYGEYPSLLQAHAASEHLPEFLRQMNPWVKSYGDVQAEIKTRHLVT